MRFSMNNNPFYKSQYLICHGLTYHLQIVNTCTFKSRLCVNITILDYVNGRS